MNGTIRRHYLVPLALVAAAMARAYGADQRLTVDGLEVFYGIVPTAVVRHDANQHDFPSHSGSQRRNARHLLIALYDAQSGRRIEDATVVASVTPLGMAAEQKPLSPMRIDGIVTFGNFFDFPAGSGPFRIELRVGRPCQPFHTTTFEYRD